MTYRAVDVLRGVECIAAEDTRRTKILLDHYNIPTNPPVLIPFNKNNHRSASVPVMDRLKRGLSVAIVTDAGTPCISDPGKL